MDLSMAIMLGVGLIFGFPIGAFMESESKSKEYRIIKTELNKFDKFIVQVRKKFLCFHEPWEVYSETSSLEDAIRDLPMEDQIKIKGYEIINLKEIKK